jgi:hypothetical protein
MISYLFQISQRIVTDSTVLVAVRGTGNVYRLDKIGTLSFRRRLRTNYLRRFGRLL